ncbi:MAG: hypothetical protein ACT4P0_01600 [Panacagrimonas sp.]
MAGIAALAPLSARAEFEAFPYVGSSIQYDNNVFRTRDANESLGLLGDDTQQDTLTKYAAGLETQYKAGLQRFFLKGEGREYRYDHYDNLDHDGYEVTAGTDWNLGSVLNGTLRLGDSRLVQDFANISVGADLGFQRYRDATGTVNLRLLRDYELRTRFKVQRLRHTLDASRDQDRNEQQGAVGLALLGDKQSSIGLEVEYTAGDYINRVPTGGLTEEFDQIAYQAVVIWVFSEISRFEIQLGVTDRDNQGSDVEDYSGATGAVYYQRSISAKTNVKAGFQRRSYSVDQQNENFVVITGGDVNFSWSPTRETVLTTTYANNQADFRGATGRTDRIQSAGLKLEYIPRDWLVLMPNVAWEDRASNFAEEEFDDFRIGLEVRLRYPIR